MELNRQVRMKHGVGRIVGDRVLEADRNGMVILEAGTWQIPDAEKNSSMYGGSTHSPVAPLEHIMEGLGMSDSNVKRSRTASQDSRPRQASDAKNIGDAIRSKTQKIVGFIKGREDSSKREDSINKSEDTIKESSRLSFPAELRISTQRNSLHSSYLQFQSPKTAVASEVSMSATTATLPQTPDGKNCRCSMQSPLGGRGERVFAIEGSNVTPESLPDLSFSIDANWNGKVQVKLHDYVVSIIRSSVTDLQFTVEGCTATFQPSTCTLVTPRVPEPIVLNLLENVQLASIINTASVTIEAGKSLASTYKRMDPSRGDPRQMWLREYHMVMQDMQSSLATNSCGQRRSGMDTTEDSEWIGLLGDEEDPEHPVFPTNIPHSFIREASGDFITGVNSVMYEGENREAVAAATISKLVERLAGEKVCDQDFIDVFLLCYRHFTTVTDLIQRLLSRFQVEASIGWKERDVKLWRPVVKLRAISVVRFWVDKYWFDFAKPEHRETLKQFILAICFEEDETQRGQFEQLARTFCSLVHRADKQYQLKLYRNSLPASKKQGLAEFIEMDSKEVAMRLTVLEHEKFRSIGTIEFVLHIWGDKQDKQVMTEIHNIIEMIESFNHVSYWVGTEIVTQPDLNKRTRVVEMMIKVAKELHRLENYNSLLSVVSGLSGASVTRLKQTWEGVGNKYREQLKELEQIISPERNYANYRAIYQQRDTIGEQSQKARTPFIPIFGTPHSREANSKRFVYEGLFIYK
jgi:hypothetical protein